MKYAFLILTATMLYSFMPVNAQLTEKYEKIECYVFKKNGKGRIRVYHQHSSIANDDFYTTNLDEAMRATNMGFSKPKTAFFIYRKTQQGTVKLYRMYNGVSADHFYTTSFEEVKFAKTIGYKEEGFIGYVYPRKTRGTVPLFRFFTSGPKGNHRYSIHP